MLRSRRWPAKMSEPDFVQIFHRSLAANGRSFCCAFLTLSSYDDAMKALSLLDRTQVKGRHIRMMLSHRVTRRAVNLTVDGIDHSIDSEKLRNLFSAYGNIVSCRVTVKGSGYVQFDSEDSAMAAIISLHETIMQGKKFLRTYEGTNTLHGKNLDLSVNDTTLKEYFSRFCLLPNQQGSLEAMRSLHVIVLKGRLLWIHPARPRPLISLSPANQGLQKDHPEYLQFFQALGLS